MPRAGAGDAAGGAACCASPRVSSCASSQSAQGSTGGGDDGSSVSYRAAGGDEGHSRRVAVGGGGARCCASCANPSIGGTPPIWTGVASKGAGCGRGGWAGMSAVGLAAPREAAGRDASCCTSCSMPCIVLANAGGPPDVVGVVASGAAIRAEGGAAGEPVGWSKVASETAMSVTSSSVVMATSSDDAMKL